MISPQLPPPSGEAARTHNRQRAGAKVRPAAVLLVAMASVATSSGRAADPPPAGIEGEAPAQAFLDRANAEFDRSDREQGAAVWVNVTYLTDDTDLLVARANARDGELHLRMAEEAHQYLTPSLSPRLRRSLSLVSRADYMPEHMALPADPALSEEMTAIQRRMASTYGTGRYCPGGEESCQTLAQLSAVLRSERDPEKLLDAWSGWRTVSRSMRNDYQRFAELSRAGARDFGFPDLGEMWRSAYDMPADELSGQTQTLWVQVKPLYEQLHCYARNRLADYYGESVVPRDGPIPAHLLGDMWAQNWNGIFDVLEPYPGVADLEVTKALESSGYGPSEIARAGERFFTSMGLRSLPESFWERSMLSRPADRAVVCRATAWNINPAENDVRISQCITATEEQFVDIHHELGHVYYYLAYNHLPNIYRRGANGAFHEAIGDAVILSLTPGYYHSIGLMKEAADSREADINSLMKLALDRVAFLPFGLIVDQWRWGAFSGDIPPDQYNRAWWELRIREQGVSSPVARTEADFDPGAKYHVSANMPYLRYFLARILQFQLHQAMCAASGWKGPLYRCSNYGNKAAGRMVWSMMEHGASQPWQDTLQSAIGSRDFDASAMLEYFAPLEQWLRSENAGRKCGW